nr:PREDICTED: N-glycosylase/DNA lyase [Lepisosteus oculatus]
MSRHAVLSAGSAAWRSLPCPRSELRLDLTLGCGQSFRWRETSEGHWTGVLGGQVWTQRCSDVESTLRELGFGYRARFVQQSAKHILDTGGPDWLESLRDVPYLEAQSALRTLPGVGLKVADCVCLMSLDKPGAVPIDTHVWQIARRDYLPDLGSGHRSLTDRVYRDIGEAGAATTGSGPGASSVLFCADLKKFQRLKPEEQLKAEEESAREAEEEARGKGAELGEGGGEIAVKRKRERT